MCCQQQWRSEQGEEVLPQLKRDRDSEWISRAMEFEKALEDTNPKKRLCSIKTVEQQNKEMFTCHQNCQQECFHILPVRQAPSVPELEHFQQTTYTLVSEESSRDSAQYPKKNKEWKVWQRRCN
ncbi:hypothetical protein RB195_013332 [Necator americanus]|uniref:Uncharacterized protein n=1 Tax=Necator americanus TaxID=51031 RepID=A0ABR1DV36_NECAM